MKKIFSYMRLKANQSKLYFGLVVLAFLLNSNPVQASHMMGADISYKCLSNLKFEVTIKVYRDCRGVSFSNPGGTVRCVGGGSGSASLNLSLSTIRDVTPICSKEPSRCNPKNTYGTGDGIEEHTY